MKWMVGVQSENFEDEEECQEENNCWRYYWYNSFIIEYILVEKTSNDWQY
jgi:hypothetical protein